MIGIIGNISSITFRVYRNTTFIELYQAKYTWHKFQIEVSRCFLTGIDRLEIMSMHIFSHAVCVLRKGLRQHTISNLIWRSMHNRS